MLPDDPVIGVEINGDVRAYPRRIIDWHEMVNDVVEGVPVSLAYCTLCGSAVFHDGRLEGRTLRFGTSGLLYRSNKLMYDRETRTLWEQYSGEPVWGPLVGGGLRLEVLPAVHTRWSEWSCTRPQLVLDAQQLSDLCTLHYALRVGTGEQIAEKSQRFALGSLT